MGVMKFKGFPQNVEDITIARTKTEEENFSEAMAEDHKIIRETLKRMYIRILNSDECPSFNVQGCTESIIMRSVSSAMSYVRYEMKDNIKLKED